MILQLFYTARVEGGHILIDYWIKLYLLPNSNGLKFSVEKHICASEHF